MIQIIAYGLAVWLGLSAITALIFVLLFRKRDGGARDLSPQMWEDV